MPQTVLLRQGLHAVSEMLLLRIINRHPESIRHQPALCGSPKLQLPAHLSSVLHCDSPTILCWCSLSTSASHYQAGQPLLDTAASVLLSALIKTAY